MGVSMEGGRREKIDDSWMRLAEVRKESARVIQ